ncbi:MAG: UDP-N-acetylglucosamine--N-acetylmuramyl-(pentapeptide) pyrophosphoryl-undecaprenol N-acetylglucosamine transferase [Verrucomicrobiota bacterium]|nr:UDP-N-acetylglucosamine--N-acetylmuramyl-(pentapeptide) pyrophosphoryl-undecaprenol N-acetylglucosamine transferase [Verrucomicrobiota bacterium]
MKRKVLIAAGGTGGHLLPAQQLAQLVEEQGSEVLFAGYKLDRSPYFSRDRFRFREIASAPLKKRKTTLARKLLQGFFQALWLLLRERPHVIVGFGSYHVAPVLFAAALLRKKIILYEPNRILGKVNRLLVPFAQKIAVQFPLDSHPKFVPISLFPWIRAQPLEKEAACRELGLDPKRRVLLIFGGSQGASFLNETMPEVVRQLGEVQVIHLAGSDEAANSVRELYAKANVSAVVKGFESKMHVAYSAADFAVCRSGAGTIGELLYFQLPALLIPYPYAADDHQQHNAEFLTSLGGCVTLAQPQATPPALVETIQTADWAGMKLALRRFEEQNRNRIAFEELLT